MYSHVLLAVAPDADAPIDRGLEAARALVAPSGKITALMVVEDVPGYVVLEMGEELLETSRGRITRTFQERFEGIGDVTAVVTHGHAGRDIVDWAGRHDVDCIVIMSHRPGIADLVLGSTAARVVRHADASVHVLR